MILLTGHYQDPDARRTGELRECVRRNAQNPSITDMWVFVEDGTHPADVTAAVAGTHRQKVHVVKYGRRLTFDDLFSFAARFRHPRRFVIANADIFFDATLRRLACVDLANRLLCLSRWDVHRDGSAVLFDHPASQDAWIFQTPLAPFECGFHLGVPGCDNRLAWEAARAGIELSNPSRSIRAHHLHLTSVHHYGEHDRLAGPTRRLAAGHLDRRGRPRRRRAS